MNLKKSVMVMVALLGVVLTVIALQGTVAGEWETIGRTVALVIGMISVIALIIMVMVDR